MHALVQSVRNLASRYPDFVYRGPRSGVSDYHAGGDPNYPHLKGCIIAQALQHAGLGYLIPSRGDSEDSASDLVKGLSDHEAFWLDHVQQLQVEGNTWSDCIRQADRLVDTCSQ